MLARRIRAAALVAALLVILPMAPASSAPQVSVTEATVSDGQVTVVGTATFPAITTPQSVVGDEAINTRGDLGGSAAGDAAGLDLIDARIQPLANGSGLRFIWYVSDLPDQGIPPEIVRYTWSFKIGTRLFQLQAKSTNVASSTTLEDPVGHAQQLQGQRPFFQLRGACTTSYLGTPVQGCYHLAFLQGAVSTTANTISVDLPFNTRDSIGRLVAPEFVPGAVMEDNGGEGSAGMVIAASFQAVVSNTITSHYINGIDAYRIGEQLHVAVGAPGANPAGLSYTTAATRSGDSFTATLPQGAASNAAVYVRACHGTECTYASGFIS